MWTNPYLEPAVYRGPSSRVSSHACPRPSAAPNIRKRTSDGEPKFHLSDIEGSKPRSNLEDGKWRCSCGFTNKAVNTSCGGFGRLGCKKPRPGVKAARPDERPKPPPPPPGAQKYTLTLEIGIENDNEFRVSSRVIRFTRKIWQDDRDFQQHGGKIRLRGRGLGGEHEDDIPLTLFIVCFDEVAAQNVLEKAEEELRSVHAAYRDFCNRRGTEAQIQETSAKTPDDHGERPENAPSEEDIELLIESRNEARKNKDWAKADEIRDTLKESGVVLMDEKNKRGNLQGADVTRWRYWRD